MSNQDRDWLDERLALTGDRYVPDAGFTARVVDGLPRTRNAADHLRNIILTISSLLAMALVVLLVGPLIRTVNQVVSHSFRSEAAAHLAAWLHEPLVLYGGACGLTLLGIAAIPLLRRWV